jgi:RNA polymerase sigma-70 factor (ECF subfamily)
MQETTLVMLGWLRSSMGSLAAAFLAAAKLAEPEPPELEQALERLGERGRVAHPEITLDLGIFAAHLSRCGAVPTSPTVHAEDLYLACAALLGDEVAVEKIRRVHRPVVIGYLRHIDASGAFVDEVEQRLWDGALVGSEKAAAKLAAYAGHGALAGWVGIAAQRLALMIRRHEAAEERAVDRVAAEAELLVDDPELAFIKGKLRDDFRRALSHALGTLGDRDRLIYRLHLVDGLTVETIGRMYGVSHSTVSRWLARVRESVIGEAQRLLRDEMGLTPAEFDSVAGLVVSQLDLSVSRILKPPSP